MENEKLQKKTKKNGIFEKFEGRNKEKLYKRRIISYFELIIMHKKELSIHEKRVNKWMERPRNDSFWGKIGWK